MSGNPPNFRERAKISRQDIRDEINKIKLGKQFVIKNENDSTLLDVNQAADIYLANVVATLIKKLQEK